MFRGLFITCLINVFDKILPINIQKMRSVTQDYTFLFIILTNSYVSNRQTYCIPVGLHTLSCFSASAFYTCYLYQDKNGQTDSSLTYFSFHFLRCLLHIIPSCLCLHSSNELIHFCNVSLCNIHSLPTVRVVAAGQAGWERWWAAQLCETGRWNSHMRLWMFVSLIRSQFWNHYNPNDCGLYLGIN